MNAEEDVGSLAGWAYNATFTNIVFSNSTVVGSPGEYFCGGLFGSVNSCKITNVACNNINISGNRN